MVTETQDGEIVINQPAGHVENGESLQQAVIRETLEESGWQVEPEAILGLYAFTPFTGADTYHRVCFICKPIHQVDMALDEDIIESNWLTKDDIVARKQRSPLIMQCINDYERGQSLAIDGINNRHIFPS
ncbi:NUDIX domain-containing protein [Marinomonas gallaica]|uniref:NUDIX domain-containing protein n=1 Tax=Marinomonas gallaica TaxID=1806667 RepID=UPI003CE4BB29